MSAKNKRYRSGWYEEHDPDSRTAYNELARNHRVCSNCYRPIRYKVVPSDMFSRGDVSLPDELSPWREDTTDDDAAGRFCECGSDGVARTTPRNRQTLSLEEVVDLARYAVWSMTVLGYDVDYVEVVGEAERLKTEDELGDDTIVLEAVSEALKT